MESLRWFTAANRLVTCCARTRWRLPSITWLINLSSSQHIQILIFKWLFIFCILVPMTHYASQCPIHSYCLNGGICLYYQSIGELACRYLYTKIYLTIQVTMIHWCNRCSEGFTGQRCQFKKAMKFQSPVIKGLCFTNFVDTIFTTCFRLRCLWLWH